MPVRDYISHVPEVAFTGSFAFAERMAWVTGANASGGKAS
jgi:hypothetical protein